MKKRILLGITLLFCSFCYAKQKSIDDVLQTVSVDIASKCVPREIVAILEFQTASKDLSEYISSQLIAQISENSTLQIVTRSHMDKIEKELNLHMSGYVTDETALDICKRLGAHQIIFGSVTELDNKYQLHIKMLNVESGSYSHFKIYEFSRSAKSEQLLHHAATIYKSSLGLIVEANKNSISKISPAAGLSFEYSIFRRVSLGIKTIASFDIFEKENSIYVIEPLIFGRWYAVSPTGEPSAGLYVEPQGGLELIFVNDKLHCVPSLGASLGFRIPINSFYFEPYLRGGYPYLFGAGLGAGLRF